jgi:hypothetical protein
MKSGPDSPRGPSSGITSESADKPLARIFQNDTLIGAALTLFTLAVYVSTLAPGFSTMDAGELAAVSATLGIAHPTGYPLFTLIGRVFSILPIGDFTVLQKLNFLSAACCAGAVFVFYRFFLVLPQALAPGARASKESGTRYPVLRSAFTSTPPSGSARIAAACAALTLGFSRTVWAQSVSVEVYALHLLLLGAALWLVVLACENPDSRGRLLLASYALGLAFTNHLTTTFAVPAILWLFFVSRRGTGNAFRDLALATLPFCAALSLYAYFLIRSKAEPLLVWGDPSTLRALLHHVRGQQYSAIMFESANIGRYQLSVFTDSLVNGFGYWPLGFAVLGVTWLFRFHKTILVFSLLAFLTCLLSLGYGIPDIASYFLLAHVAVAAWIHYGMRAALNAGGSGLQKASMVALCAGAFLTPLLLHHHTNDGRKDFVIEDYARNMLANLDSNALILSEQEEAFTFPAYYLQRVVGVRTDVAVIEPELLLAPWYYTQLERMHPGLLDGARVQVERYLVAAREHLARPESTRDPSRIRELREDVVKALVRTNLKKRSVYMTLDVEIPYLQTLTAVPDGLALRILDSVPANPHPRDFGVKVRSEADNRNLYWESIMDHYAAAFTNNGLFSLMVGDTATAAFRFRKAVEFRPGYRPATEALESLLGRQAL